jgi:hypothetical protein
MFLSPERRERRKKSGSVQQKKGPQQRALP